MAGKKPKNATPRKPPPAPAAAAFVAGGIKPSGRPDAQTSTTTITRVRSGETLRRLTVYLPEDVARAVRVRCAQEDRTLSDVLTELAGKWAGA